jgi:hypothetical protein
MGAGAIFRVATRSLGDARNWGAWSSGAENERAWTWFETEMATGEGVDEP